MKYLNESSLDEGFMDHLKKLTKLGEMGSKAKAIFTALASFKDGDATEATMALIELMPQSDDAKSFKGKISKFIEENQEVISKIKSADDVDQVIEAIGPEKIKEFSESKEGSWLKDFKAFVIKNEEKFKQVLQVITNGDLGDFEELSGFEVPSMVRSKAEQLLKNVSEKAGEQADKISGFLDMVAELPVATEEVTTESRNLFNALSDSVLNESLKTLAETCSKIGNGYIEVDIPLNDYPENHTSEDGRMLDYGSKKSDSHEGRMTKAKLFRLAQMAQSLHDRMQDGDDLPEWVQDKITTSEDRIGSAYKYIDYKLRRINEGAPMADILFESTYSDFKDAIGTTRKADVVSRIKADGIDINQLGAMASPFNRLRTNDFIIDPAATRDPASPLTSAEFNTIRDYLNRIISGGTSGGTKIAPVGDFNSPVTGFSPGNTKSDDWFRQTFARFLYGQGYTGDYDKVTNVYKGLNDFMGDYPSSDFTVALQSLAALKGDTSKINRYDKSEFVKAIKANPAGIGTHMQNLISNVAASSYTAPVAGTDVTSAVVRTDLVDGTVPAGNNFDESTAVHLKVTADVTGLAFTSQTSRADKAEVVAAVCLGAGAEKIGSEQHSYDARAGNGTKWEVKLLSKLGETARLGAGGAAVGSKELTKLRNVYYNLVGTSTDTGLIDDLREIRKGEAFGYDQQFATPGTTAHSFINSVIERLEAVLALSFGSWDWEKSDVKSLLARGEVTRRNHSKILDAVREIDMVIRNCENYGDSAALLTNISAHDGLGPITQADDDFGKRLADYLGNGLQIDRREIPRLVKKFGALQRLIYYYMGQKSHPAADKVKSDICSIEKMVVDRLGDYLNVLDVQPDGISYAVKTLFGNEGYAQFIKDYCNAETYTATEKTKKKIAGFIFVVSDDAKFKGASVYIIGRDKLDEAAQTGILGIKLVTSGFTQGTPSIGIRI